MKTILVFKPSSEQGASASQVDATTSWVLFRDYPEWQEIHQRHISTHTSWQEARRDKSTETRCTTLDETASKSQATWMRQH